LVSGLPSYETDFEPNGLVAERVVAAEELTCFCYIPYFMFGDNDLVEGRVYFVVPTCLSYGWIET